MYTGYYALPLNCELNLSCGYGILHYNSNDFNIPYPSLTTKATIPRPPPNSARIGDIWPASVCDRRWKDRKVQTTFTFSKTAFVCPYSWCSSVVGPLLQEHIFLSRRCKFVQYKWLAKRSFIASSFQSHRKSLLKGHLIVNQIFQLGMLRWNSSSFCHKRHSHQIPNVASFEAKCSKSDFQREALWLHPFTPSAKVPIKETSLAKSGFN